MMEPIQANDSAGIAAARRERGHGPDHPSALPDGCHQGGHGRRTLPQSGATRRTARRRRISSSTTLRYAGAEILIAGRNFGSGSSREHAVWALTEYGFRCVITPGFADIFYNNSLKNGLLLVPLPEDAVNMLLDLVEEEPSTEINVDLEDADGDAARWTAAQLRHRPIPQDVSAGGHGRPGLLAVQGGRGRSIRSAACVLRMSFRDATSNRSR